MQTQLPLCLQRRQLSPRGVLVRLPESELPKALNGPVAEDQLRADGPLGDAPYSIWSFRRRFLVNILVGWTYNLCALAYGLVFLFYAILVKFDEAGATWSKAVFNSFALSTILSLCLTDLLLACLLASLPLKSSRTKGPINFVLDMLQDI